MRDLTSGMQTAITADILRVALFAQLETTSSSIYLTSLPVDTSWNAQTWLGNGWLRPFGEIQESSQIQAVGATINLGGLDATAVSTIFNSLTRTNKANLWLGLLDSSYAIIADPEKLFSGQFESANLTDDGSKSLISLHYENQFMKLSKTGHVRYTDQSQQALFPGDLGFKYVNQSTTWSGFWGKAARQAIIRKRKTGGS